MTLLAIETSCDETSVAVVRDGKVLSSIVSSQIKLHAEYGGVVPELAAREHLRNLIPVAQSALSEAGISVGQLDAVAATQGPGLPNALLVGFKAAQAVAFALGKPFIGINHHEAHLYSPWISGEPPVADFSKFQPNISLNDKLHGLARLKPRAAAAGAAPAPQRREVTLAIGLLLALIFSKYFYLASLTSYYTFYLIHRFNVSVQNAQLLLFVFLAAVALGTIVGGPLGDRFGRKYVIWASILGVLPFTLILPHANLLWTSVLTVPIGMILASAFPAIVVYAQELMPGRTGTVAGLFFGFAFGMGGIGAAVLGKLADAVGITTVYQMCAFLPLIGLLAAFLPNVEHRPRKAAP